MANQYQDFQKEWESYFSKRQEQTLVSKEAILQYAANINEKAKSFHTKEPTHASYFYFLAAYSCFFYLYKKDNDIAIFDLGQSAINQACNLVIDEEYVIVQTFYDIMDLPQDPLEAFEKLKNIDKKCPTFRLIQHNLLDDKFLETIYNDIFSDALYKVTNELTSSRMDTVTEEALLLLSKCPSPGYKLTAYNLLGKYYLGVKNEEALRCFKLGIEIYGSSLDYDYHNQYHRIWGDCWTEIANCQYKKKDFDFALSLYEKGANLGIIECMEKAASMYEKGEGDDPDPVEAAKYKQMAEKTRKDRDEERRKIEAERKAREEAIIEAERLAEEEAQRKERERKEEEARALILAKNRAKKVLYSIISIVSIIVSIWCLIYLSSETIIEKASQLKTRGNILLLINDQIKEEYIIFKDSQSIKIINKSGKTDDLLFFDKDNKAIIMSVKSQSGGGIGTSYSSPEKSPYFSIQSDQELFLTEIVPYKSYVITSKRLKDYQPNVINHAYLLQLVSSGNLLYCFDNWDISYQGEFEFSKRFDGHLAAENPEDFLKTYSKSEYQYFLKKGLTKYSVNVRVKAEDGVLSFTSDADFNPLDLSVSASSASPNNSILKQELLARYNGELTPRRIQKLVFGYVDHHISSDGKSTFVISKDKSDAAKEPYVLYEINNRTEEMRKIRDGIKIRFESDRIYVKAYDTFLLFFDSSKDVYYSYSGIKLLER